MSMRRRLFVIVPVVLLAATAVAVAAFFGVMYYVEYRRVQEGDRAFRPLLPIGVRILSNPIAFNRYCCYFLQFPAQSKLSDANIRDLDYLNHLPDRNELDVFIETPMVTDASLPYLKAIRTMDRLDVTKTAISDEGIEGLRRALPETTVFRREESPND